MNKLSYKAIFAFSLSSLLFSCEDSQKPSPIIPLPQNQNIEINVNENAIHYFSLSEKKVLASHKITDWDLCFSSEQDKYYIYINTAKHMRVSHYDGIFSDSISEREISNWQTDVVKNGKLFSAIGNWGDFSFTNPKSYGKTYIVDLGYIWHNQTFGYRKIEILDYTGNSFKIKYGHLNDPFGDSISIEKKTGYNHTFLQMDTKARAVEIEPPSSSWDLTFTQYGLNSPYTKNGGDLDTLTEWTDLILLNSIDRFTACDTINEFDDISFWDIENYVFDKNSDYIGNKWRAYNSLSNSYEISKRNTYVIKKKGNFLYLIEFQSVDKSVEGRTNISFRIKNL